MIIVLQQGNTQCNPVADSLELVNIYNQWDGPNWTNPWDLEQPIITWAGIEINNDGCVSSLNLYKRNLSGEIFDINLPFLEYFSVSRNYNLTGEVPDFSNIPFLGNLSINGTGLTGSIPDFSNLPNLVGLFLSNSNFSGTIPDFSNLPNLITLEMYGSNFFGPIPDFSNLPNLIWLTIFSSNLEGNIPNFSNLPLLVYLTVRSYSFFGPIPDFSNLTHLEELNIQGDSLIGIPDFSDLPNLKSLIISGVAEGGIPDFSNLTNLNKLEIYSTNLSGAIPDFSNIATLESLQLINGLSGEIPDFSNLPNLRNLVLQGLEVSGEFPNFSSLPNLEELRIYCDSIIGQIPEFQNCQNLKTVYLFASFSGNIPNFNLENLEKLLIGGNSLDTIPNFSGIPNLQILSLGQNELTGRIPNFSNLTQLKSIYLGFNYLEGDLLDVSIFPDLENFNVRDNLIEGILPDFSQNPNLKEIELLNNSIKGIIPSFENNPLLDYLWLQQNDFDSCSVISHQISNFRIEDNHLSMDDIIPNLDLNPNLKYNGQKNIPVNPRTVPHQDGVRLILDLDEGIEENTFYWKKNGVLIGTTNTNGIILPFIDPEDEFIVSISNPNAPIAVIITDTFKIGDIKPILKGTIFKDETANCTFDPNEIGLQYWDFKLTGESTYYTRTDPDGKFEIRCDTGQYVLEVLLPNNSWQICPIELNYDLQFLDTVIVDIPVQAYEDCAELSVNLGVENPFLRRCFQNRFVANYCNQGTTFATDVKVQLQFDPWIIIDSMNIDFTQLGNGLYEIEIDSLDIGDCKTIQAYVTTNCDAPIGIAQGVTAHIYPDTLCSPLASEWSGATIDVAGNCTGEEVRFVVRNVGSFATSDSIHYRIFKDGSLFESEWFQLAAGDSIVISKPATGASWRLESDQAGNHPCSVMANVNIEGCGTGSEGEVSTGYALQFPDAPGCPFEDRETYEIIGSYDPNDLQAFPRGFGPEHYIEPGTKIEYLIRFQNVGNDTAFNVYVLDTLSELLDPSTIFVEQYSLQYQLEVTADGVMKFSFLDINLVDSTANEMDSHGFIRFSISPKADVPLGSVIYNQAAIVFDFNDPVITNSVFHTIDIDFYPDEAPPFWSQEPADLQLECGNDVELAIENWLSESGGGFAQDDSGEITIEYDYQGLSYTCGNSGTATVIFTAKDSSENSSQRTASIEVLDTTPPQWEVLPQNLTLDCDLDPDLQLSNWLDSFGGSVVSDSCGNVIMSHDFTDIVDCNAVDTLSVIFFAEDDCVNTSQAGALIFVDYVNSLKYTYQDFEISVFPNPAKETVIITWNYFKVSPAYAIKIFDVSGLEVHSGSGNERSIEIPIQNWVSGVYFVELVLDGKNLSWGRFLKG